MSEIGIRMRYGNILLKIGEQELLVPEAMAKDLVKELENGEGPHVRKRYGNLLLSVGEQKLLIPEALAKEVAKKMKSLLGIEDEEYDEDEEYEDEYDDYEDEWDDEEEEDAGEEENNKNERTIIARPGETIKIVVDP